MASDYLQKDCWRALPVWGPVPSPPEGRTWEGLMRKALLLAQKSASVGEIPVGALVADAGGAIVSLAHNESEALRDPTAHAEVLALRRAAFRKKNRRLEDCVLVVTLEPCLMCAGALREARIQGVVYGASDAQAGAVFSRLEGLNYAGPGPWFMGGILAEECATLLRDFFFKRR